MEAVCEARERREFGDGLLLGCGWLGREKEEVEYLMDRYLNWAWLGCILRFNIILSGLNVKGKGVGWGWGYNDTMKCRKLSAKVALDGIEQREGELVLDLPLQIILLLARKQSFQFASFSPIHALEAALQVVLVPHAVVP